MKHLWLLIVALVFSANINAQSVSDLERNPSFKGIRIGDDVNNHKENLQFFARNDDGSYIYNLSGSNFYSVMGVKMEVARVYTKDEKIESVVLERETKGYDSPFDDVITIASGLKSLYGAPQEIDEKEKSGMVTGLGWTSNNYYVYIALRIWYDNGECYNRLMYCLSKRSNYGNQDLDY